MIRINFTPDDFTRVTLAPRPAPLQELNTALMTLCGRDGTLLHGAWRRKAFHALPAAAAPLADLVPAGTAPSFLDAPADSLQEALDDICATPRQVVSSELERVYVTARKPAPSWVRALHGGDTDAVQVLGRAFGAAYESLLAPVWPEVQDRHHMEFVRLAVQLAQSGVGTVLAQLLPGARLDSFVWELPGKPREIHLAGRGVVLLPSFHWYGDPLLIDLPDRPVTVTYAAGSGLLPQTDGGTGAEALAKVIGPTRTELLHLLAEGHSTTELARRLGVSAASVSAHTAALRGAGLISTSRAGKAVLHRRTALGDLLLVPR
ncbi:ArsR/SmtB family transcription factor [Streptacidiphilus fuscans]|uniref:Winged helix-turn-helix transcriptional regulator n=1 Tax=Streptacidiphilus fuscans TaxID=2789292 RepID=A0A931B4Z3_9ACTN|nr:ArsR family transcriptional regulator [Streptacidiphilus fuscans]MBF9069487.1 winged helix-turn-helix transcriptional regulator [Streptacidiphilus fuscans]